jgi:hypothetical protein
MSVKSLRSMGNDFITGCPECAATIDVDAEIVEGRIVRVWPYRYQKVSKRKAEGGGFYYDHVGEPIEVKEK